MRRSHYFAIFIPLSLLLLFACTSRYRLDLKLIQGEQSYTTTVESSQYVLNAALSDPYGATKWEGGDDNVAILGLSVKGRPFMKEEAKFVLDNQLRCRLYLQLPSEYTTEVVSLPEASFLQVLGQYDWPADETIFPATGGAARIDSVANSRMFLTLLDARFANPAGRKLALYGQLKFKITE